MKEIRGRTGFSDLKPPFIRYQSALKWITVWVEFPSGDDMNAENITVKLWPELPLNAWKDTYATLHMWTQIVGKVRLALCPRLNHWWEVPLYVTSLGLTT